MILIFVLRLPGDARAMVKVSLEMFVINFSHSSFFMKTIKQCIQCILVKKSLNLKILMIYGPCIIVGLFHKVSEAF